MGKYLKLFNTSLEYNRFFTDNENVDLPNVSICEDNKKKIYYNGRIFIKNAFVTYDYLTYNGEFQNANNIIVTFDNHTLINEVDYMICNNTGGIDPGNYTFKLMGIGKYKGEITITYAINKVTPTVVAPTAKVLTYNGSEQELINAGSTNLGTMKYSLNNENWSTDIPLATKGGSYVVYYKVECNDNNVKDVEPTPIQCSINEHQPTITIELSQDTYTYDGNIKEPIVTIKDGSTIIPSTEYTISYLNNINAGTSTVVISDVVNGDYYIEGTQTFTINKITPTVVAPTAKTLTYNGESQELINAGSTDWGTLKYSLDNSTWSTNMPTAINAESYTVYYKVDGDNNINDIASSLIECSIDKVTPTVVAPTAKTLTYNGESQELINAGSTNCGTLKYSLDNSTWSTNIPTAINVGSYAVYYKVEGNSNINDIKQSYITCSIDRPLTATYNVTTTSNSIKLLNSNTNCIKSIIIDGVEQQNVITSYTFDTLGEHTVMFTLNGTIINSELFYDCNELISITIPNTVTSVNNRVFEYCSNITSITIPNSVTSIGNETFAYCSELTSIIIGEGVNSIDNYAFYNCSKLTSITSNAMTAPSITSNTFKDVSLDGILTVPSGSTGYDTWMNIGDYYLGSKNWTKIEQ